MVFKIWCVTFLWTMLDIFGQYQINDEMIIIRSCAEKVLVFFCLACKFCVFLHHDSIHLFIKKLIFNQMKTKLLLIALVAALAIPMQGQNFRHTDNVVNSQKAQYTAVREVIPEGMVMVTLAVGDVWGDGTGYQMLLDADANTYGTYIPETGPMAYYTSVPASTYAEFEYKIPENADGSVYTENFLFEETVSILIPAGTYDWVITNPEYGWNMWIAASYEGIGGRYDDFVFEAGKQYIFTPYLIDYDSYYYGYDAVALEVVDGQVTPPEPPTPTEKTGAPTFHGYTEDGIHGYFVEIIPTEPSVIYYRIIYPDGTETEWAEYEDILSFEGDGKYRVEAYAVAPGKLPSEEIAYEFVVAPVTGIDEMMNGKTVAGVRYFNMAGQEMSEANGLTIVVTTYTDGTTNAVKVVR